MGNLKYQYSLILFPGVALLLFLNGGTTVLGIDFESVVREAMGSNPELKSYYRQWRASQKETIVVRALPEPKVTYTEFLSEVQTRTGPQERALQLNQPFPWPGKLALRGGIANHEAEAAFHRYEALQREIIRTIADSYFAYALLGESIRISEQNVSYLEQLLPVIREKVRGGGNLSDSLVLEIEKEKAADSVAGLKDRRPTLSSALETEMGKRANLERPLPFPSLFQGDVHLPELTALEAKLEKHPLVAAACSKVLAYDLKRELAGKAALPDLSLGASVIDIGNGGDTAFGVVLGFSVPIRKRRYEAEREQACLEKDASIQLRESILNDLRTQLHREYQGLKDARRRVSLFRDRLIPKAEQSIAQIEESYRGDRSGIDEIVDAEKLLLRLRLERLEAVSEMNRRAILIRVLTEPLAIETTK